MVRTAPTAVRTNGPLVSGRLFEGFVHTFPDWFGAFGRDLLSQRCQFLRLFRQRFELLAQLGRRELDRLGRRLGREKLGRVIKGSVEILCDRLRLDGRHTRECPLRYFTGVLEAAGHLFSGVFYFVVVLLCLEPVFFSQLAEFGWKVEFASNFGNTNGDLSIDFDFALEEGVAAASSTM